MIRFYSVLFEHTHNNSRLRVGLCHSACTGRPVVISEVFICFNIYTVQGETQSKRIFSTKTIVFLLQKKSRFGRASPCI